MTCDHEPEELRVKIIAINELNEEEIDTKLTPSQISENYMNKCLVGLDVESHEILETGNFVIWHRVKPTTKTTKK
jgi:hypothetical protein